MNELLKIILSLSLSGALLILVLLLCKPLVKDKLSKRWQYYIWLIVVVRLLLPFAPETNLMGMVFQHFDNAIIQTDTSPQSEQIPSALSGTDFSDQHNVPSQAPDKVAAPDMFEIVKQNIAVICLLVWLIVAVGLLIRKITVYQSFVKYIKAGRIEISDMQLWERVGKLVEQTGIKGAVGLYTNSLISSPLLIGFFRPCIMLPTTELSESDFENTILHELTHYKRRDMFYKWLVQLTICLHWFNPFAYIMGREVNRACELSCDEAVIKSLDESGRRAYGDTLLNAMGMGGKYKDSLASVTLNESKELLKERLDAIMNFKKKTKGLVIIAIVAVLLVATAATLSGAYVRPGYSLNNISTANTLLPISNTSFTTSDYEQIIALQFVDYEKMTISEYRNNVWERADTETFTNLFEEMTSDSQLYDMQDTNPTASFLFHTLLPLISGNWETNQFRFGLTAPEKLVNDSVNAPAELEVTFTYSILKPEILTIGEYEKTRDSMHEALQQFLSKKSDSELQDSDYMNTVIQAQLEELCTKWSNENFAITDSDFYYVELLNPSDVPLDDTSDHLATQGTEAAYHSLLQLKTGNYKNSTVEKFNLALLNWVNENADGYEQIIENDIRHYLFPSFLNDEEKKFLSVTVRASNAENSMSTQSYYSETDAPNPGLSFELLKGSLENNYASLMYGFSYHIDATTLTVGERDSMLSGIISDVHDFWDNATLEELSTMSDTEIYNKIDKIIAKYNTSNVNISFDKSLFSFETSTMY